MQKAKESTEILSQKNILQNALDYIKEYFSNDHSGHDAQHTIRVYKLASKIAEQEAADLFLVQLASLLHDVDDRKLSPDTSAEKNNAVSFMKNQGIEDTVIRTVCTIIDEISFAGEDSVTPQSIEGKCVQDADRLDAIGAIGIARAFTYGGNHDRVLYDPQEKPCLHMSKEEYHGHISTTINHFYEKLFLLKDLMNTAAAKEIAEHRDQIMRDYIEEFLLEWDGVR